MGHLDSVRLQTGAFQLDAGQRLRISSQYTLGDHTQQNYFNTLIWDTAGTGTNSFSTGTTTISCGVGQYRVLQTKQWFDYFTGKGHSIEWTMEKFNTAESCIKRIGYYSSSTGAPYTSGLDGIFLQNNNGTISLNAYRAGQVTASINQADWDDPLDGTGASGMTINWDNFNIFMLDFLWLGGLGFRFFVVWQGEFHLVHTYAHAGSSGEVMIQYPNKPFRAELINNSDAVSDTFKYICSNVSSEGTTTDIGFPRAIHTTSTTIACNTAGTRYFLKSYRQLYRENVIRLADAEIMCITANANYLWEIVLNPTFSGGTPAYSSLANSGIQEATGNGTITCSGGTTIHAGYGTGRTHVDAILDTAIQVGSTIAGTFDQMVLCVTPFTNTNSFSAAFQLKELP